MSKPSWIDEVKEITEEEARLLTALGVQVAFDYSDPSGASWYTSPLLCMTSHCPGFWAAYEYHKDSNQVVLLLFVEKDDDDE